MVIHAMFITIKITLHPKTCSNADKSTCTIAFSLMTLQTRWEAQLLIQIGSSLNRWLLLAKHCLPENGQRKCAQLFKLQVLDKYTFMQYTKAMQNGWKISFIGKVHLLLYIQVLFCNPSQRQEEAKQIKGLKKEIVKTQKHCKKFPSVHFANQEFGTNERNVPKIQCIINNTWLTLISDTNK